MVPTILVAVRGASPRQLAQTESTNKRMGCNLYIYKKIKQSSQLLGSTSQSFSCAPPHTSLAAEVEACGPLGYPSKLKLLINTQSKLLSRLCPLAAPGSSRFLPLLSGARPGGALETVSPLHARMLSQGSALDTGGILIQCRLSSSWVC